MYAKLKKMMKENKKGFTLIELIVVIAILAILMALAVPAYTGLKKQSASQVAKANARSCYTAIKAVEAMNTGTLTATELASKATEMLGGSAAGGTLEVTTYTADTGYVVFTWTGDVTSYTNIVITGTESSSGVTYVSSLDKS